MGLGVGGQHTIAPLEAFPHQGGMSDPLIVHWPKGHRGGGEVRGQYARIVVDVTPTILGGAGLRRPVLDGVPQRRSRARASAHRSTMRRRRREARAVLRDDRLACALWADGWKAVVEQPQGDPLTDEILARQKWELYHVERDFSSART